MAKLCRAHLRMRGRLRSMNTLRAALVAYGAIALALSAVLYFGSAPRWAPPLLGLTSSAALLTSFIAHSTAERRLRWYRTGTAQCGACRAVAEGRRTPDGEPMTAPKGL